MSKTIIAPTIKIEVKKDNIKCILWWDNLPKGVKNGTYSIVLSKTDKNFELALRYQKAVEAGVVYKNPQIVSIPERKLDQFELAYASKGATTMPAFKIVRYEGETIFAKYMNHDLKKLGY